MSDGRTLPTTQKAAKRHRCTWCWQSIEPGELYTRCRTFSDGDACTIKMHPECFEEMQRQADEEGGWFEWVPGQERPPKLTNTGST